MNPKDHKLALGEWGLSACAASTDAKKGARVVKIVAARSVHTDARLHPRRPSETRLLPQLRYGWY